MIQRTNIVKIYLINIFPACFNQKVSTHVSTSKSAFPLKQVHIYILYHIRKRVKIGSFFLYSYRLYPLQMLIFVEISSMKKAPLLWGFVGDPTGNRTRVTAVKGRCLDRLTIGPNFAEFCWILPKRPTSRDCSQYFAAFRKILLCGSGNWIRTGDTSGMNRML